MANTLIRRRLSTNRANEISRSSSSDSGDAIRPYTYNPFRTYTFVSSPYSDRHVDCLNEFQLLCRSRRAVAQMQWDVVQVRVSLDTEPDTHSSANSEERGLRHA